MSGWADSIDRFSGGHDESDRVLIPAFIGALAALAASFVTWATMPGDVRSIDVDGINGDGRITAALAWIALLLVCRHAWRMVSVLSAAGIVVACLDVTSATRRFPSVSAADASKAGIGYGLWLCLVGFSVAFLAALWAAWSERGDVDDWTTADPDRMA